MTLHATIRLAFGLPLIGAGGSVANLGSASAATSPSRVLHWQCPHHRDHQRHHIGREASLCAPQSGQIFIIVVGSTSPDPTQAPVTVPPTGVTDTPINQMTGIADPRVDTYANRHAIRDQYRGHINETTFNDELADGVGLDQALKDALAEFSARPATSP